MRRWWPLVALCLGTLMLLIDVTIVTVALPALARDLHASPAGLQWVMDAYALGLAALLLGAGSLADQVGRRKVYLVGLAMFAAASLACALAADVGTLVAARGVQAVGAAAMLATTIALLNVCYHGTDRAVAFGGWGAVSGAAAALGPIAGGLLTQYAGWRWIFLVNLPVSVAAIGLTLRALPESRAAGRARLDLAGLATFTVAAAALTDALIRSSDNGWTSTTTLGQLLVATVALGGFVAVERRRAQPMLDLGLFGRPAFVAIMLAATLVSAGAFAYLPYTSLWLQSVLGHGAVDAGLTILPLSLAALVVSAGVGRVLHDRSPRWPVGGGLGLIGAGALLQALVRTDSSATVLLPGLLVAGVGVGLAVPSLSSAALAAVPAERSGMASGAVNAFRQLGFAVGIAVFGAVFQSRAEQVLGDRWHLADAATAARALGGGQAHTLLARAPAGQRAAIDHLVHQAVASGLSQVCLAAAAMGLLAGLLVVVMLRRPSARPPAPHPTSDTPPATLTAGNATAARVHDR